MREIWVGRVNNTERLGEVSVPVLSSELFLLLSFEKTNLIITQTSID